MLCVPVDASVCRSQRRPLAPRTWGGWRAVHGSLIRWLLPSLLCVLTCTGCAMPSPLPWPCGVPCVGQGTPASYEPEVLGAQVGAPWSGMASSPSAFSLCQGRKSVPCVLGNNSPAGSLRGRGGPGTGHEAATKEGRSPEAGGGTQAWLAVQTRLLPDGLGACCPHRPQHCWHLPASLEPRSLAQQLSERGWPARLQPSLHPALLPSWVLSADWLCPVEAAQAPSPVNRLCGLLKA